MCLPPTELLCPWPRSDLDLIDLSGTLPSTLGKYSELESLVLNSDFRNPRISGSMPTELGMLTSLKILRTSMSVSGSLPTQLGKLVALRELQVHLS